MQENVQQEISRGEQEYKKQIILDDLLNKLVDIFKKREDTLVGPRDSEDGIQYIINLARNLVNTTQKNLDNDLLLGLKGHSYKAITPNVTESTVTESMRSQTFLASVAPPPPITITDRSSAYSFPLPVLTPFIYAMIILRTCFGLAA